MKNNLIILLICIFVMVTNCSNNDDNNVPPELLSSWSLRQVSGGIGGIDESFEQDEIVWSFKNDETLEVENSVIDHPSGFPTGVYMYTVKTENGKYFFTKGETNYGEILLSDTELIIDGNVVCCDFTVLTFNPSSKSF